MKQLLLKMRRGEVGTIAPTLIDSATYAKSSAIKSKEWVKIVEDAFIWMDYFSIPQPGAIKESDDDASRAATMRDMKRAIASVSYTTTAHGSTTSESRPRRSY